MTLIVLLCSQACPRLACVCGFTDAHLVTEQLEVPLLFINCNSLYHSSTKKEQQN